MSIYDISQYALANKTREICEMVQLSALLKRYDLFGVREYVDTNNPSRYMPYHNNQHMQEVALNAVKLYRMEEDNCQPVAAFGPRFDEMTLLVAGLFHDYGHSGGLLPDKANIAMACEILNVYAHKQGADLPGQVCKEAIELIRITEFPFVHEPKTSLQRILRDADLLGFLGPHGPYNVISSLRLEMNVKAEKPLSPMEMYERQVEFVKDVTFFTKSAQQLWDAGADYQLELTHRLAMAMSQLEA